MPYCSAPAFCKSPTTRAPPGPSVHSVLGSPSGAFDVANLPSVWQRRRRRPSREMTSGRGTRLTRRRLRAARRHNPVIDLPSPSVHPSARLAVTSARRRRRYKLSRAADVPSPDGRFPGNVEACRPRGGP